MTDLSAKLDEIAMHYHDMTGDNDTVPWEKCSSRYRTQVRKMVRNAINCQALAQQTLRTKEAGDVVKGLEWVKHDSVAHIANTIVGPYIAEPCGPGEYRAWLPDDKKLATRMVRGFYSFEAAKAAAQADYTARILSALTPAYTPNAEQVTADTALRTRESEAVAWRWRRIGNKHWIYDPTKEWVDDNINDHALEFEPLYTHPTISAESVTDADRGLDAITVDAAMNAAAEKAAAHDEWISRQAMTAALVSAGAADHQLLRNLVGQWHDASAKAFTTQASDAASYYIKLRFKTLDEMHRGYDAILALAKAHQALRAALTEAE